jgi:hypothetical protein
MATEGLTFDNIGNTIFEFLQRHKPAMHGYGGVDIRIENLLNFHRHGIMPEGIRIIEFESLLSPDLNEVKG